MTKDEKQDRKKGRLRTVQEFCQSKDELWDGSDNEIYRTINMVTIQSFNNICSVIVKKLKTTCNQKLQC